MRILGMSLLTCLLAVSVSAQVLDGFEDAGKFSCKGNEAFCAVEAVPGHTGNAVKFTFQEKSSGKFITRWVGADPRRDEADGLALWVKGDGSANFGGIELIDKDDYKLRYAFIFPLKDAEWHQVVVPYWDIIPELPAGQFVDPAKGYKPSQFGNFWPGKWFYHREYPAHSYCLDDLSLVKWLEKKEYPPAEGVTGIPRSLAKLQNKQPITIVAIGDSLTDSRHWANRETVWPTICGAALKKQFGYDAITVVNSGVGGNQLNHGSILMPRDMVPYNPDLVTIFFGYNDFDSGMRGPHFKECLAEAVDRARRLTEGKAEILLMTTCPALERWTTMAEMAEAVRAVAAEKRTGLADIEKAFHAVPEAEHAGLYVNDKTHLASPGDHLVADTVLKAIVAGAKP